MQGEIGQLSSSARDDIDKKMEKFCKALRKVNNDKLLAHIDASVVFDLANFVFNSKQCTSSHSSG